MGLEGSRGSPSRSPLACWWLQGWPGCVLVGAAFSCPGSLGFSAGVSRHVPPVTGPSAESLSGYSIRSVRGHHGPQLAPLCPMMSHVSLISWFFCLSELLLRHRLWYRNLFPLMKGLRLAGSELRPHSPPLII